MPINTTHIQTLTQRIGILIILINVIHCQVLTQGMDIKFKSIVVICGQVLTQGIDKKECLSIQDMVKYWHKEWVFK